MRKASHADSWYSSQKDKLISNIDNWFSIVEKVDKPFVKAIISPHAGYRFCGSIAAQAYSRLSLSPETSRIFVLGPSHFYSSKKCLLSPFSKLETPILNLDVDVETNKILLQYDLFDFAPESVDLKEHSLEMQYPMLAYLLSKRSDCNPKIIPIIVPCLEYNEICEIGTILQPFFERNNNLFIISSDFCHYGQHFNFFPFGFKDDQTDFDILKLDQHYVDIISTFNLHKLFALHMKYHNTICGIYPISILVKMIEHIKTDLPKYKLDINAYSRSSKIDNDRSSSSVGYLAASIIKNNEIK